MCALSLFYFQDKRRVHRRENKMDFSKKKKPGYFLANNNNVIK